MKRQLSAAALVAAVLAGLLPHAVMAADPVAKPDNFRVDVDAAASALDVLSNDTDADAGDTLTISNVDDPAHGAVVNNGSTVEYQPDPSFHGTDTFDYTVEDSTLGTSTATVTVVVNNRPIAVDDPPTACQVAGSLGGSYPIPEDYLETGSFGQWFGFLGQCSILANDSDPNGDALTFVVDSGPSHGELYPDPTIIAYKPDPNYSTPWGDWVSDSITYRAFDGLSYSDPATLRLWISPVNDPPSLTPGGQVTVAEDSGQYSAQWATNVSPGPNEADQTVHFELQHNIPVTTTQCGEGPLFVDLPAIDGTGVLTFSVRPDCAGSAHVTFRPTDDGGTDDPVYGSLTPRPDDTGDDVSFDIVVTSDGVLALDDPFAPFDPPIVIPEDPVPSPRVIDVLANDVFPPGARIIAVSQGSLGSVTIAADGLSLLYAPQTGVHGTDSFTYTLSDGPASQDTATVTVTIAGIDSPPAGADATVTALEDTSRTFSTSDFGFSDPLDTPPDSLLAVRITTVPLAGALSDDGAAVIAGQFVPVADIVAGKLAFLAASNANGSSYASFTFQVQDDGGTANGGTDVDLTANVITIDVTAQNDAPVAAADSLTVSEDVAIAAPVDVLGNDTDVEGDTRTITGKTNGTKGVVAITGSGTGITYRPNGNASGTDSFTYTISDGHGGVAVGMVTVTITASQDPPNGVNDGGMTVPESAGPTALSVLANDIDVDGDSLTIVSMTNGAHGTVTINPGGTGLTYDPAQLYVGQDQFTYTVSDGHGNTDQATVVLTVIKDTTKPAVVGPAEAFYAQTVATSTTRARISWSGSDAGTGIARYELQVSVNGGSFTSVALASATSTSINRTHTDERSYRYRVRATDRQGNVSAWVNGPSWKPGRIQNTSTSITYSGPWATVSNAGALGGSHRYASSLSARASITRSVRDFAWVATRTAKSGSAQVWIDGVLAATVNLRASSTIFRQVVFSRHFSTLGTHRMEIRPIGGGVIHLDAFLIMR